MKTRKIISLLAVALFFGMGIFVSFVSADADSERKYAETRMFGCEENDILIGDKVWASCNSNYDLTNSLYYSGVNENSVDINGWKYGKSYFNSNVQCPAGYRVPTYYDFTQSIKTLKDIRILKLPAAGYRLAGNQRFKEKDSIGSYVVTWLPIENPPTAYYFYADSVNGDHLGYGDGYNSLRCIRIEPATTGEKMGNRNIVNQSKTGEYGIAPSEDFNISSNLDFAVASGSTDEYENAKLKEINDCFLETYSGHLDNINTSIQNLLSEKRKTTNNSTKFKYQKAINKLNNIKNFFIKRYSFLFIYGSSKTNTGTGLISNKNISK